MYIERPSLTQKGKHVRVWIAPQGLRYEYAPSLEGFLVSEAVTIETGRTKRRLKVPSPIKRDFDTVAVIYSNEDNAILGELSARLSADTRSVLLSLAQSNTPFDMIWAYGTGQPNNLNDYEKVQVFHKARADVYTHEATGGFYYDPSDVMERISFYVDDYNDYTKPELLKETNTGGRVTDVKIVDFNMCVQCMEVSGCCEYFPVIVSPVIFDDGLGTEFLYLLVSHDGGDTWVQHQIAIGLFGEPKVIVQGTRVIILPDSDIAGEFYYIEGKYLLSNSQSATITVNRFDIDSLVAGATTELGDTILVARNGIVLLVKPGQRPEQASVLTTFESIDVATNCNDVFLLGNNQSILWLHGTKSTTINTPEQYTKLWAGQDLSLFARGAGGEISWYKPGKGSWHATGWFMNDMNTEGGVTYKADDIGLHVSHDALNSSLKIDNGMFLYVDSNMKGQQLAYATDSDIYISLGSLEQQFGCPYGRFESIPDTATVHTQYICDSGEFKLAMSTTHEGIPGGSASYSYTIVGPYGTSVIPGAADSYAETSIPIPTTVAGDLYTVSVVVIINPGAQTLNATTQQHVPCNIIDCGDGSCIECYNKVPLMSPDCCL